MMAAAGASALRLAASSSAVEPACSRAQQPARSLHGRSASSSASPSCSCSSSCSLLGAGKGRVAAAPRARGRRAAQAASAVFTESSRGAEAGAAAPPAPATAPSSGKVSMAVLLPPVAEDMASLDMSLRNIVGERHPMLMAAAEQIFGAGGKRVRPMLVFLVARATAQLAGLAQLTQEHRRLAEITEMIHTASLVHDDVLDDCNLRRGARPGAGDWPEPPLFARYSSVAPPRPHVSRLSSPFAPHFQARTR